MFSKTFNSICHKNTISSLIILSRNYGTKYYKTDLKVQWTRPEKISCLMPEKSGDLSSFEKPDPKNLLIHFEKSEELKKSDELVKKIFSLECNNRKELMYVASNNYLDLVKRHDYDYESMEAKVARMTARIRMMQDHMKKFPLKPRERVNLKELIERRMKTIRKIRRTDYKKFEWLIEKLDIVFKPFPEEYEPVTRKGSLKKLCKTWCDGVRQDRLDAYRKELQSKQIGFLEDKIKNLEFIRSEQLECKIPVTVTLQEINDVKKQLVELKEKKAEEAILQKKQTARDDYEMKL